MSTISISSEMLYHSFLSGAQAVLQQKKELNAINVFPVADGDTGSNLASTMYTIIEESSIQNTARNTFQSIADAALIGARGNSGIIFAQYINGITMSLEDTESLSLKDFADSVKKAVPYAYDAIATPVEGTMITVIRDWADAVYALRESAIDFVDILSKPLEVAFKSLLDTPNKLKVLKDANVVDSGAKGFVHFIEGFLNYIITGKKVEIQTLGWKDIEIDDYKFHKIEDLAYRYCTEALLSGTNLNHEAMKKRFQSMGDSCIVAGNTTKARFHIHTNTPQDFFYALRGYGKIVQQKVDDMKKQYETTHERKYNIALVTDSIADMPQAMMDEYQIHMIPLNLILEDSSYLDKVTITPQSFYTLMDEVESYPTSAQPNTKTVENLFSFLSSYYDSIIAITISKEMSGTYNTVCKAAEKQIQEGKKITIINSKLNSGAEGLVVMKAAEEIAKGRSHEEVVHCIEEIIPNTQILVSVNTLKYMVRSGRVSKVTGIAGKIMNLKPVVGIDQNGKGIIKDKAFSVKGNTKKLIKTIKQTMSKDGISRYAIVHANAPDRAKEFEKLCTDIIGYKPTYVTDISAIVAMSAGIGSVAVATMSE